MRTVPFSGKSGVIWLIPPSVTSILSRLSIKCRGRSSSNAVDAKKLRNILSLVEYLFCLPVANGHVERVFSQLKIIKTERRTHLGEDRLESLLRIVADAPSLLQ